MKTINIMTSCDGNLMKFIPVQLESITENLKDRAINFYLFHDGQEIEYVEKLRKINYPNIKFHDIIVEDTQIYDLIASKGGNWCGAAYYSLCAYKYLPPEMDRIWYIDAGDILVLGDVDAYYFADFENKSLIATSILFKIEDDERVLFNRDDLFDKTYLEGIARGIFNSGSYVMNLNKMRQIGYKLEEYANWAEMINNIRGNPKQAYFGDQGFLSIIYVGDIKFYTRRQEIDILYMPYNFCLWYFDKSPHPLDYEPAVIHFIGDRIYKPWKQAENNLHESQKKYYDKWCEYALKAGERQKWFV